MSVQQPPLYPFFFEPILKRALWGGRRLGTVFGRSIGAGSGFAESWDLSDWETAQSRVSNGTLR
ncbi:MAG: mannose-6-phosphate isomerase, partial [Planctomycetes bacterium]|nr:mannose-6-phosphate isomerase [Planctomycetota bacterium]